MMQVFALLVLLTFLSVSVAFRPVTPRFTMLKQLPKLAMSESENSAPTEGVEMMEGDMDEERKMFDMNRRVRLGRSRDQDGKSNIWSIEPTMQVIEEDGEGGGAPNNLLIGGMVIGAAIACLPLFNAFSSLFPDPSDF